VPPLLTNGIDDIRHLVHPPAEERVLVNWRTWREDRADLGEKAELVGRRMRGHTQSKANL
jgi:hypothetical protein